MTELPVLHATSSNPQALGNGCYTENQSMCLKDVRKMINEVVCPYIYPATEPILRLPLHRQPLSNDHGSSANPTAPIGQFLRITDVSTTPTSIATPPNCSIRLLHPVALSVCPTRLLHPSTCAPLPHPTAFPFKALQKVENPEELSKKSAE